MQRGVRRDALRRSGAAVRHHGRPPAEPLPTFATSCMVCRGVHVKHVCAYSCICICMHTHIVNNMMYICTCISYLPCTVCEWRLGEWVLFLVPSQDLSRNSNKNALAPGNNETKLTEGGRSIAVLWDNVTLLPGQALDGPRGRQRLQVPTFQASPFTARSVGTD